MNDSPSSRRPRRLRGDDGATVVETALLLPVLYTLVFGLIAFGLVLGFKQTTEEAASEGARAALINYNAAGANMSLSVARLAALDQAESSMGTWEPTCDPSDADGDGLGCWAELHDCTVDPAIITDGVKAGSVPGGIDTGATPDCITVVVFHDYDAEPFLPRFPFVDSFLPNEIITAATVQMTD